LLAAGFVIAQYADAAHAVRRHPILWAGMAISTAIGAQVGRVHHRLLVW
jgi:hypothetical protein